MWVQIPQYLPFDQEPMGAYAHHAAVPKRGPWRQREVGYGFAATAPITAIHFSYVAQLGRGNGLRSRPVWVQIPP